MNHVLVLSVFAQILARLTGPFMFHLLVVVSLLFIGLEHRRIPLEIRRGVLVLEGNFHRIFFRAFLQLARRLRKYGTLRFTESELFLVVCLGYTSID